MPDKSYTLSVIIIAKNEADRIETCLKSISRIADEIILFDSGSTDQTVEIAQKYTEKIFVTDWPGYGPQKQRALDQATGEWVLSIDSDEALSPELEAEIEMVLSSRPREAAFRLKWGVVIFGRLLAHGRSARAVLRLFRREGASFSKAIVHEKVLIPEGKIGRLNHLLLHYDIRDFEHYLHKNSLYAWLWAKQQHQKKRRGTLLGAALRAIWVFFQIYIIRGGVLDGAEGFLVAAMYSQYSFNKYAGLWSLGRQKK